MAQNYAKGRYSAIVVKIAQNDSIVFFKFFKSGRAEVMNVQQVPYLALLRNISNHNLRDNVRFIEFLKGRVF